MHGSKLDVHLKLAIWNRRLTDNVRERGTNSKSTIAQQQQTLDRALSRARVTYAYVCTAIGTRARRVSHRECYHHQSEMGHHIYRNAGSKRRLVVSVPLRDAGSFTSWKRPRTNDALFLLFFPGKGKAVHDPR